MAYDEEFHIKFTTHGVGRAQGDNSTEAVVPKVSIRKPPTTALASSAPTIIAGSTIVNGIDYAPIIEATAYRRSGMKAWSFR